MSRMNKTIPNLQKVWNELDIAYEKMENVFEMLGSMSDIPKELSDEMNIFDISAISSMKSHIEMMIEKKEFDDNQEDFKQRLRDYNTGRIYVVKFSDGSYYIDSPTQICLRKEDAKRMTWAEAEELRDEYIRIGRKDTVVEPA